MLKFIAFHVGYHISNRKEASVLMTEMRSLNTQNYRAVKQLQRLYTDKVQTIVERGAEAGEFDLGDSRIATFALLEMVTSVARWYSPRGPLTVGELIGVYTDLAFAMLGAKRPASVAQRVHGAAGDRPDGQYNRDPITHFFDIGSHVLQISVAPHPKGKRPTNGAATPDPLLPTQA
jgi:hypothetical protein